MDSSSIFKPVSTCFDRTGQKKFLATSLGHQLGYLVNFNQNKLTVFHLESESAVHTYSFPEEAEIVDVDYFPAVDGTFGIVVGIHDESSSWGASDYVVGLLSETDDISFQLELVPKWSLSIPAPVSIIKTLFTNEDMNKNKEKFKLISKLEKWSHVIAVGCKMSHCYLVELKSHVFEDQLHTVPQNSTKLIDIMDAFMDKARRNFIYSEGELSKKYIASAISVSAIAILPRSRTLLVGLSMGGIITAALNPSNNMNQLSLRHERLIRYLVPLEPEDDPEKFEYFIAAADGSPRHPLMIHLWRGAFKAEDANLDEPEDSDTKYDTPYFYILLEHRISASIRWITAKTLTFDRFFDDSINSQQNRTRRESIAGPRSSDESTLNISQTFGSSDNRSSALFVYEKVNINGVGTSVEASVFDIDAFYYKRMPPKVTDDGTNLRQCAFLSTIRSNIPGDSVNDVSVLIRLKTDISRFSSTISDSDQLFYPSSLNFDRVFIAQNHSVQKMRINSLQETILDHVAKNLPILMSSPKTMALKILSAGIVPNSILQQHGSPNSSVNSTIMVHQNVQLSVEELILLNAMLYHGRLTELNKLATISSIDEEKKEDIAKWAFYESCDFRKTIVDRTCNLFDGSSMSLSPVADKVLSQGVQLFYVVHQLLLHYAKHLKDGTRLKKFAEAVKCSGDHTCLVRQFITYGIVPANARIEKKMKDSQEIRVKAAIRNKTGLPIQLAIRRLHILTPEGLFWNEKPHDQWYPPSPFDVLEPVLNVKVPERTKRELIIQYIVDWIRASQSASSASEAFTDEEVAKYAHKIISYQFLETNIEKILYVLEKEKEATKDYKKVPVFGIKENIAQEQQKDGDIWNGEVKLVDRLSNADKERFEKRYRLQKEKGARRLTDLDEEDEELYQVFLFNREKYTDLSENTVKSNKLLSAFLPHLTNAKKQGNGQTDKEKEIQEDVKALFERNKNHQEADGIGSIFTTMVPTNVVNNATLAQKVQDIQIGRKRKSLNSGEHQNYSPLVPPSAKRLTRKFSPVRTDETQEKIVENVDHTDDLINEAIQTPARYLRRQANNLEDELSPTYRLPPPTVCPNSILKTAKSVQSPSRGRIRFHESVAPALDEKTETPKFKSRLDFDNIDEDDEDEITPKKSNVVTSEKADDESDLKTIEIEDETIEIEKSFEVQEEVVGPVETASAGESTPAPTITHEEEFHVYEDALSDAVEEKKVEEEQEEFHEVSEGHQEDAPEVVEEPIEEELIIESEVADDDGSKEQEQKVLNETFDIPNDLEEKLEQEQEQRSREASVEKETAIDHYVIYQGGMERSFEVQKDEDVEPIRKIVFEQNIFANIVEEKTKEVQEDESPKIEKSQEIDEEMEIDEPARTTPSEPTAAPIVDETFKRVTRSRTNSRCETTPPLPEASEMAATPSKRRSTRAASVKKNVSTPKRARSTSRSRSVVQTSEVQEDEQPQIEKSEEIAEDMEIEEPEPEIVEAVATPSKRKPARAASVQRNAVTPKRSSSRSRNVVEEKKLAETTPEKPAEEMDISSPSDTGLSRRISKSSQRRKTASSTPAQTATRTLKSRTSSPVAPVEEVAEPVTPSRRGRARKNSENVEKTVTKSSSRARSTSITVGTQTPEEPVTPKRGRSKKPSTTEESKTPVAIGSSKRTRSTSRNPSVVPEAMEEAVAKTPRRRAASSTLATKAELEPISEDGAGTSTASQKRTTRSRTTSATSGNKAAPKNWKEKFMKTLEAAETNSAKVGRPTRSRTTSKTEQTPKPAPKSAKKLENVVEESEDGEDNVPVTPRRSTRRAARL